jgi:hypothetical protein
VIDADSLGRATLRATSALLTAVVDFVKANASSNAFLKERL